MSVIIKYVCMRICVCVCIRVCVRACVCAYACACLCMKYMVVRVCVQTFTCTNMHSLSVYVLYFFYSCCFDVYINFAFFSDCEFDIYLHYCFFDNIFLQVSQLIRSIFYLQLHISLWVTYKFLRIVFRFLFCADI